MGAKLDAGRLSTRRQTIRKNGQRTDGVGNSSVRVAGSAWRRWIRLERLLIGSCRQRVEATRT